MSKATVKATAKAINPAMYDAYVAAATGSDAQVRAFIEQAAKALQARTVSLAVLKDTIASASRTHHGFTIKAAHAQDMRRAYGLMSLAGADARSAHDLLTLAVNMRDRSGRTTEDADKALRDAAKNGVSLDELAEDTAKRVTATNAARKAEKSGKGAAGTLSNVTADDVLRAAVATLRELDDVTVTDRETVRVLLSILKGSGMVK